MVRTLKTAVATNILKAITEPIWLLELTFAAPVYFTSGRVITHDSKTFDRQGLRIRSATDVALKFVLRDDDDAIKALVDAEGIDDIAVTAWNYYETDGDVVWTGFTDGVRFRRHEAEFGAHRIRQGSASCPERFFNRADFPYLPPDGKVVKWNGLEITLRSR